MKFLKSDEPIRNNNIMSFNISLPGRNVIRWTVLKKDEEGIMEFTSAGIIIPVWNSGERITRLAILEGEKIR